jgi:hypothetical protein
MTQDPVPLLACWAFWAVMFIGALCWAGLIAVIYYW